MVKRNGGRVPFWLRPVEVIALQGLYPKTTGKATAWRYTVVVPREQVAPTQKPKASFRDLNDLRRTFVRHFCGVTPLPASSGYGLRHPEKPQEQSEHNINVSFVVYSAPIPEADHYFRTLQDLLKSRLEEGVILIEKIEVLLL